ncbi:Cobyrinic acid a,c-diamide synthase [Rhodovulum sp. PH10]|uniref:ParA family protein n=1 Tax=Rhodovulum sp. PH10 TaxID=1187851 RepID=UPI00027C27A7|nr:ParA family protein [Rhodovulum sp. PH10]EJW11781.1 Cobyrinic acid a,c-diamide synthase [Rhodovulum sp. PH10]
MNIVTLASRKGGAGKSTLTAHLAAAAHQAGHRCLLVDADPQGSLTLWQSLRPGGEPIVKNAARGVDGLLAIAMTEGYDWVFIDTPPTMWVVVSEAIRASTMVLVPARPSLFDLHAVRETVKTAQERAKPYAVVINAAPARRDDREAPVVAHARAHLDRLGIPVWSGQITQRAGFSLALAAGASAPEVDPHSAAAAEIGALWSAVERSVEAITGTKGRSPAERAA